MSQYYENNHRTFAVDAAYARGLRVKLNGSTANSVTVAGINDVEIGMLTAATFANLDQADVLLRSANGTHPAIASGAITANALVYPDAGGKVTATANGLPIGRALNAASGNNDFVEILRLGPGNSGKLYVATAASAAVTNTTTETLFSNQFSIPANELTAGDRIRVRYQGIATATNSTDTLAIKLYIGGLTGTALISHAATDVANNDVFDGEFDLIIRTAGASGTMVGVGTYKSVPAAAGTATYKDAVLASTAIDTTAAQVVGVSATWSVANAGNSCRLDILNIERLAA
jgi:hypothetical protein